MPSTKRDGHEPRIRESAERVWLAGLGALAVTEEEGARFFKTLVKRGENLERITRTAWERNLATVRRAPTAAARRVSADAKSSMHGVLHRLGVPTRGEINRLSRRVAALADSLEKRPPARARRRAKAAAASRA
jgi:poly(hydroxyalkanoate) granule-associated protein